MATADIGYRIDYDRLHAMIADAVAAALARSDAERAVLDAAEATTDASRLPVDHSEFAHALVVQNEAVDALRATLDDLERHVIELRARDAVAAWAGVDDDELDVPSLDWAMSRLHDALYRLDQREATS